MENSIPFPRTYRNVGFVSHKVTSNREGGQRSHFLMVFMVPICVTIYSASKLTEEDFILRLVFLALPPPLRFRRECLLPTFCSSSSLLYIRSISLADQFCFDFRFVVNLYSNTVHYKITDLSSIRALRSHIHVDSLAYFRPKFPWGLVILSIEGRRQKWFEEVVSIDDFSSAVDI